MADHKAPRPLMRVAAVVAFVSAVLPAGLSLATAFGLSLTDVQVTALLGFMAAVSTAAGLTGAKVAEKKVTPLEDPFIPGDSPEQEG